MCATGDGDAIHEEGTYVKIRYSLKTGTGDYIKGDPRDGYAIMEFFTGYCQAMPGLEKRLVGRRIGEKAQILIPPGEAFGPYLTDLVREKGYDEFPEGKSLVEGRWAEARDNRTRAAYGYYVKKKAKDHIVLDYNHPLAGLELVYDLEILDVRAATDEERSLMRPCEGSEGRGTPEGGEIGGWM